MIHFADHSHGISHDSVNRFLRRDKLTGNIIWEHVKGDIVSSPNGCLVFDDSVLDTKTLNIFVHNHFVRYNNMYENAKHPPEASLYFSPYGTTVDSNASY